MYFWLIYEYICNLFLITKWGESLKNLGVVGAGGLGSRHMQGLAQIDGAKVWVVDPSETSLKVAKDRLSEVPVSAHSVEFRKDISDLPDLDFCVVATTSQVRRQVVESLISKVAVSTLLLEKVLFQKFEDYSAVEKVLAKTPTFVNCSQRLWPSCQKFKEQLSADKEVNLTVTGSNWGLGCNAVHNIDMLSWFLNDVEHVIDSSKLDQATVPAKRPGFVEFTGELSGQFRRGKLHMVSKATGTDPYVFTATSGELKLEITKGIGKIWNKGQCLFEEKIPFQGQMTKWTATEILKSGKTVLPSLSESTQTHLPMLKAFSSHLGVEVCPIT